MNKSSFMLGWLTGRMIAGQRSRNTTPIAYLYNGVQLPALPEWDKETYPYAYICHTSILGNYKYTLTPSQKMFVAHDPAYSEDDWSLLSHGNYLTATAKETDTVWSSFEEHIPNNVVGTVEVNGETVPYSKRICNYDSDYVFWSNHSFNGPNGAEWITASDPVPVYE